MAFSKALVSVVVLVLAASAMCAAGQYQAPCNGHKVTVQNLCDHDLKLDIEPLANSNLLFNNGYVLPRHQHKEFQVCAWTGRFKTAGAAMVEFHFGHEGGAWYQLTTDQANANIPVSCTPHGHPLLGECPAAGCRRGKCFSRSTAGGNCHGVSEIKIVYCST
uniref:Uncharacterized protein n=2 Tax=Avena sativa TaxID=4498 RepID=A0ACD5YM18_AVESA